MRFLSLLVALSGCALIDANGDADAPSGEGGFAPSNIGNVGSAPTQVAIANLDGNDQLDVVVLGDSSIFLCLNDQAAFTCDLQETGYTRIATGDVDGDGIDDVIGAAPSVLDVFRSQGGGNFTREQHPELASASPQFLLTAAFPSLGSTARSIVLTTLGGTGIPVISGTTVTTTIPTLNAVEAIAAVDTKPGNSNDELLFSVSGMQEGIAGATEFSIDSHLNYGIASLITGGDFLGDDQVDLAFWRQTDGLIVYIQNSAAGLPPQPFEPMTFGNGPEPLALVSGDFTGDGRDDTAILRGNAVRVFESRSMGLPSEFTISVGASPKTMVVGDLNGDDIDDFVLTPGEVGGVDLLLSR